jgi:hypothetical protein
MTNPDDAVDDGEADGDDEVVAEAPAAGALAVAARRPAPRRQST